jgi:hypothetical protein
MMYLQNYDVMSETNASDRASQYLHNIDRVIEITNIDTANPSVLAAVHNLAEAYLSFEPYTTSKSECHDPISFLHILWCNPNEQGIEQAARELTAFLEEYSTANQIEILTSLRNVLQSSRQVPSIREDLRDSCKINNLINAALLYAFLTSSEDWDEMEEWDCFDIFLGEAWSADDREKQKLAANQLQIYIQQSSIRSSESVFEALQNGQITTPNTLWDEA